MLKNVLSGIREHGASTFPGGALAEKEVRLGERSAQTSMGYVIALGLGLVGTSVARLFDHTGFQCDMRYALCRLWLGGSPVVTTRKAVQGVSSSSPVTGGNGSHIIRQQLWP